MVQHALVRSYDPNKSSSFDSAVNTQFTTFAFHISFSLVNSSLKVQTNHCTLVASVEVSQVNYPQTKSLWPQSTLAAA